MNLIFNFIYDFDIVSDILRPELIKYYDFMIVDKEIIERHQQVNRKQKIIMMISIGALLVVLILLSLVLRFVKQRRVAYGLLEFKNKELQHANEEI